MTIVAPPGGQQESLKKIAAVEVDEEVVQGVPTLNLTLSAQLCASSM